jgi:transposase-like protein
MDEDYPRTLLELESRFGTNEACVEYLKRLRWPEGFICPHCGGRKSWKMVRNLFLCAGCRKQVSVTAGTVFQDTRLPLVLWFRAMWHVTNEKNGVSALSLQRALGLGSDKTAWFLLHKLRRAMVRQDRDKLAGTVEVDEAYWGGKEEGVAGRLTHDKALIFIAVEERIEGERTIVGRCRLFKIPDTLRTTLHRAIADTIEPGSIVRTDGLPSYRELSGYVHAPQIQTQQPVGEHVLPRAHLVISLFKRWLMGTHQGSVDHKYLDDYLNEFAFRFNRRKSKSRGKLFYRLVQQAVALPPVSFTSITTPHVGGG